MRSLTRALITFVFLISCFVDLLFWRGSVRITSWARVALAREAARVVFAAGLLRVAAGPLLLVRARRQGGSVPLFVILMALILKARHGFAFVCRARCSSCSELVRTLLKG